MCGNHLTQESTAARKPDNRPMAKPVPHLTPEEIARAIEIVWDDKPPFRAAMTRLGLTSGQVVQLMKRELTPAAFRFWTARTRSAAAPARPAPRRAPAKPPR